MKNEEQIFFPLNWFFVIANTTWVTIAQITFSAGTITSSGRSKMTFRWFYVGDSDSSVHDNWSVLKSTYTHTVFCAGESLSSSVLEEFIVSKYGDLG